MKPLLKAVGLYVGIGAAVVVFALLAVAANVAPSQPWRESARALLCCALGALAFLFLRRTLALQMPAQLEHQPLRFFALRFITIGASFFAAMIAAFSLYGLIVSDSGPLDFAGTLVRVLFAALPVGVLGVLLWITCERLLHSLDAEGPPRFETNWGLIGGGAQGWRFSASLTHLVLVLILAGLLAFAGQNLFDATSGLSSARKSLTGHSDKSDQSDPAIGKKADSKPDDSKHADAKDGKQSEAEKNEAKTSETKAPETKQSEPKAAGDNNAGKASEDKAKIRPPGDK